MPSKHEKAILDIIRGDDFRSTNEIRQELEKRSGKKINWHAVYRILTELVQNGEIDYIDTEAGLLNEARGLGGAIIGFGLLILAGAFSRKLTFTSTVVAMILFLGFGIARVIGILLDGNPPAELMKGIVSEFIMGSLALIALVKYRDNS